MAPWGLILQMITIQNSFPKPIRNKSGFEIVKKITWLARRLSHDQIQVWNSRLIVLHYILWIILEYAHKYPDSNSFSCSSTSLRQGTNIAYQLKPNIGYRYAFFMEMQDFFQTLVGHPQHIQNATLRWQSKYGVSVQRIAKLPALSIYINQS